MVLADPKAEFLWLSRKFLKLTGGHLQAYKCLFKNTIFLTNMSTWMDLREPGKIEVDSEKLTRSVIGLTIIAWWRSFDDIPYIPVAFFTLIILMRFDTKSLVIGWKSSFDIDSYSYLLFISIMLGRVSSTFVLLSPIYLATLTKQLLKVSQFLLLLLITFNYILFL